MYASAIYSEETIPATQTAICDLCGKEMKQVIAYGTHISLCSCCFTHLDDMMSGKIAESIERFIVGNVI